MMHHYSHNIFPIHTKLNEDLSDKKENIISMENRPFYNDAMNLSTITFIQLLMSDGKSTYSSLLDNF